MNKNILFDYSNLPPAVLWKNKDFQRAACGYSSACANTKLESNSGLTDAMNFDGTVSSIIVSFPGITPDSVIMLTGQDDGNNATGSWGPLSVLPGTDSFTVMSGANIAGIADTRQVYFSIIKF